MPSGRSSRPSQVAADPDLPFDGVVVGRDVLVGDRPVFTRALERAALEVPLAEAQRDRVPQHRLAADAAAPFRIEAGLAGSHRRDLASGEVERHRVRVEVRPRVDARTAFDNRDLHAAASEVGGKGASRRPRADDHYVKDVSLHARPDDCCVPGRAASTATQQDVPRQKI